MIDTLHLFNIILIKIEILFESVTFYQLNKTQLINFFFQKYNKVIKMIQT